MPRNPVNRLAIFQSQPRQSVPAGMVLIQLPPTQAAWQQHIYQLAVAKARAALAPPRYIGRFLASMN